MNDNASPRLSSPPPARLVRIIGRIVGDGQVVLTAPPAARPCGRPRPVLRIVE